MPDKDIPQIPERVHTDLFAQSQATIKMQFKIFMDQDAYIVLNRTMLHAMGCPARAVLFQYILSKYFYHDGRGELTDDGYFYCTAADREKATAIKVRSQQNMVKEFVKDGLLKKDRRGNPGITHFKPCFTRIRDLLIDTAINTGTICQSTMENFADAHRQNLPDSIYNKENNKNNKGEPGKYSDDLIPPLNKTTNNEPSKNKWFNLVAEELNEVLHATQGIKAPPKIVTRWGEALERFQFEWDIAPSKIRRVMAWYVDNVGDKYTPQISNMNTFISKFAQLDAARLREQEPEEEVITSFHSDLCADLLEHLSSENIQPYLLKLEKHYVTLTENLKIQVAEDGEYDPDPMAMHTPHQNLYYHHWWGNFEQFLRDYCSWLRAHDQQFVTAKAFSPLSAMFMKFLDQIGRQYDVEF